MIGKKLNLKKVRFTKREAKQQQITERILLRAFGTSPKSSITAGLQIRSKRYMKDCAMKGEDEYGK